MRLSAHHEVAWLAEHAVGRCSAPAWNLGVPAGFCDQPACGPHESTARYAGYVPALACYAHGGPAPGCCSALGPLTALQAAREALVTVNETLANRLKAAEAQVAGEIKNWEDAVQQRDDYKARATALEEALQQYGRHVAGCEPMEPSYLCGCGLAAALARAAGGA